MTSAQKAIMNAVIGQDGHRTAEQIFLAVKAILPRIALGTVYRNLNRFAEDKLIRKVIRANAPDYYEKNMAPHDHMICVRCSRMSDIKINALKEYMENQMGCPIISLDITVSYLCRECRETKDAINGNSVNNKQEEEHT
jgi:Fe2+ or Zn2+ uptake regulation protein